MNSETKNQLASYIVKQLQAGSTPDDIAGQLRNAGWREEDIQTGFTEAHGILQPSPLQPAPPLQPQPEIAGPEGEPVTAAAETQNPQAVLPPPIQRGKLKTGWLLFKQSLRILKGYPGLMKYPAISIGISLLLFLIVGGIYLYDAVSSSNVLSYAAIDYSGSATREATTAGMILGIAYYLLTAFVTYFFATALSAHVLSLFRGQDNTNKYFIGVARSKSGAIALYTLIDVTVGFILRTIAERFRLIGWIISKILGALWSLATTFVVPIIADTPDNGAAAVKRSLGLFKANWGQTVTGRVSTGGLAVLLYLLIFIPVMFGLSIILAIIFQQAGLWIGMALLVLGIVAFATVEVAATNILNTALYYYAQYKVIPPSFDPELLASAFIQKKKKK